MNYRIIIYFLCNVMRIEALFMVPALAVSLYYGETGTAMSFLATIVILLLCSLPGFLTGQNKRQLYAKDGLVLAASVWIVLSIFGALPFFLSGEIPNYIRALFEVVAGLTTTGISTIESHVALSKGLIFWRSFTQWMGGIGVLVFLLALLPLTQGSGNSMHIMRAESTGPVIDKIVPKMKHTAKIIYTIYCVLSLLLFIALLFGDMSLFDNLCVTFGTAGTGGFSVQADSCAGYDHYSQMVISVFMLLFGMNFSLFYLILLGEVSKALRNEELRVYIGCLLVSVILVTINLYPVYQNIATTFYEAFFQVSSAISTTGFSTADFSNWPQLSRAILLVLMITGACAGSTTGGLKISRTLILLKSAKHNIQRVFTPRCVRVIRLNGQVIDDATLQATHGYLIIYLLTAAISCLLISVDNQSMETTFFSVISCLNNSGPFLADISPFTSFSFFSDFSILVLAADMIIGRLEIFPVLALFSPGIWRRATTIR